MTRRAANEAPARRHRWWIDAIALVALALVMSGVTHGPDPERWSPGRPLLPYAVVRAGEDGQPVARWLMSAAALEAEGIGGVEAECLYVTDLRDDDWVVQVSWEAWTEGLFAVTSERRSVVLETVKDCDVERRSPFDALVAAGAVFEFLEREWDADLPDAALARVRGGFNDSVTLSDSRPIVGGLARNSITVALAVFGAWRLASLGAWALRRAEGRFGRRATLVRLALTGVATGALGLSISVLGDPWYNDEERIGIGWAYTAFAAVIPGDRYASRQGTNFAGPYPAAVWGEPAVGLAAEVSEWEQLYWDAYMDEDFCDRSGPQWSYFLWAVTPDEESGLWAPTRRVTWFSARRMAQPRAVRPPAVYITELEADAAIASEHVGPWWSPGPDTVRGRVLREAARTGHAVEVETLWSGWAHNALLVATLSLWMRPLRWPRRRA